MLTKYSFFDCVLWLSEVMKLCALTIHPCHDNVLLVFSEGCVAQ